MKPTRLFDCIEYQLANFPKEDMLAAKEEGGTWKKYSTQEVKSIVDKLATGLLHLKMSPNDMSVEGRDKIAILSNNRPEWIFLDLAVQQAGLVLVPIYPTINVNELEFVLNDAAIKLVFVSDQELYEKVQSIRHKTPSVMAVFTFNYIQKSLHWKEILTKGTLSDIEQLNKIRDNIRTEDLATIIYTSGTTGTPKGVMLSHKNILSNVMNVEEVFKPIVTSKTDRALSFLPLNHIFEKISLFASASCMLYHAP
jgi:long-chain acyl-CoA synthetase